MAAQRGNRLGSSSWLVLRGDLAVMQAPLFDGFAFDPLSLFENGFCSVEVGICMRDIAHGAGAAGKPWYGYEVASLISRAYGKLTQ